MLSNPTTKDSDQRTQPMIDPAIVLAARADRAPAISAETVRRKYERSAHGGEIPAPTVDTTFRATDIRATEIRAADESPAPRSAIATWAIRTALAVLLAICSAVAAAAWQTYGDQAQEMIAQWVPRISLSSTKTASLAQPPAESSATDDQSATAATSAMPATASSSPSAAAAPAPESTELLQSMARDLATMGQQISELKASIAQLKAGQEQMSRDIAHVAEARTSEAKPFDPKAIEQTLRPRPAPRPAAVAAIPVHRPRPAAPPATAAATPMPLQSAPPPQAAPIQDESVARPPMPVR